MKDVKLSSLSIRAREIKRGSRIGAPTSHGPWIELFDGTNTDTYRVQMYNAPIPRRIDIFFNDNVEKTKLIALELETSGITDIGEKLSDSSLVKTNCGLEGMSYDEILELLGRYLDAHGYPMELYEWDEVFEKKEGTLHKVRGFLSGVDEKKALDAIRKWLTGYSLSEKEMNYVIPLLKEASKLPKREKVPEEVPIEEKGKHEIDVDPRLIGNTTTINIK